MASRREQFPVSHFFNVPVNTSTKRVPCPTQCECSGQQRLGTVRCTHLNTTCISRLSQLLLLLLLPDTIRSALKSGVQVGRPYGQSPSQPDITHGGIWWGSMLAALSHLSGRSPRPVLTNRYSIIVWCPKNPPSPDLSICL